MSSLTYTYMQAFRHKMEKSPHSIKSIEGFKTIFGCLLFVFLFILATKFEII